MRTRNKLIYTNEFEELNAPIPGLIHLVKIRELINFKYAIKKSNSSAIAILSKSHNDEDDANKNEFFRKELK